MGHSRSARDRQSVKTISHVTVHRSAATTPERACGLQPSQAHKLADQIPSHGSPQASAVLARALAIGPALFCSIFAARRGLCSSGGVGRRCARVFGWARRWRGPATWPSIQGVCARCTHAAGGTSAIRVTGVQPHMPKPVPASPPPRGAPVRHSPQAHAATSATQCACKAALAALPRVGGARGRVGGRSAISLKRQSGAAPNDGDASTRRLHMLTYAPYHAIHACWSGKHPCLTGVIWLGRFSSCVHHLSLRHT